MQNVFLLVIAFEICRCTELTWGVQGQVLSDPAQRAVYDEIHGYTATAINPFFDDSAPKDHVFVDEFTCIGILILSCE